jgi:hypothetical protein
MKATDSLITALRDSGAYLYLAGLQVQPLAQSAPFFLIRVRVLTEGPAEEGASQMRIAPECYLLNVEVENAVRATPPLVCCLSPML